MPSVALPVSATGNNRAVHPQPDRDTRATDPGASPFSSLLNQDDAASHAPARSDAIPQSDEGRRADASQRQNRPERSKRADANDDTPPPAQSKADDTSANNKNAGGKTADAVSGSDTPKSDGDADKPADASTATDASAATEASAALTDQTLDAVAPVAVVIAAPQPLQNVQTVEAGEAAATAVAAVQVSAVAQATTPVDPKAAAAVLATPEKLATGKEEKGDAAIIPGEVTASETKPAKSKTDSKPVKAEAKDTSGDAETATLTDAETNAEADAQAAAVAKPAQHAAEEAKAAHGKAHAEKEADKTATTSDPRTNFAANLATTSDAAQQVGATSQNGGQPITVSAAAATTSTASQSATSSTPVPLAGLAVEIATHAKEGKNRFEIRLDPPDLGRIDVRLDIDRAGNVTSRLVVERTDTLDLLRRDSSTLERALNDAGLKTGDNGLQFSLRDQNAGGNASRDGAPTHTSRIVIPADAQPAPDAPLYRGVQLGGLDIRV